MVYYHLRYNIYPPPGFPVEKEDWICFTDKHNEQEMKIMLMEKEQHNVSIIVSAVICKEEYELKSPRSPELLSRNWQLSLRDFKNWKLSGPANMHKTLKDAETLNDFRYRNILQPAPLL
jgi:hypothetical protein